VDTRCDAVLAQFAPLCQHKFCIPARSFDGFHAQDDSDPAAPSMSPAMSAISFVMDGVAHAANDGNVSIPNYCSASNT
jgi:hypothetical protein